MYNVTNPESLVNNFAIFYWGSYTCFSGPLHNFELMFLRITQQIQQQ